MTASDNVAADGQKHSALAIFLRRYRGLLTALAVLVVFVAVTLAIYRLTGEISYQDVLDAMASTTWTSIALAVLFTGLSFAALICYDFNAIAFIGKRAPLSSVAMTAFSAYAIGNTAGFGPLSGGAIRFRAYSRLGFSPGEITRIVAFVTLAFGIGLLAVCALSMLIVANRIGTYMNIDANWLRGGALLIIGLLAGLQYFGRNGRVLKLGPARLRLPDTLTSSRQFLVTAFDIAASASVLYMLLPETHVGWPSFLAIYAAAVGLGVLSHVPAGLGVFETVIVAGLGNAISVDALLGSLLLYRLVYHVLPLLIAVIIVLTTEVRQLTNHPVAADIGQTAVRLAPSLLSTLALMLGAMLIFSSVTPSPDFDLDFLSGVLPLPLVEGAHFLSSVLGLALVISSRGINQRLDGAWWVGLLSACAAFVLSFIKALAVFEASFLALFIVGMLINARSFTRPASLFRQALSPSWLGAMSVIIVGAVAILLFVYRDTEYSRDLWWQFEFMGEAPRGLRALLGLVLLSSVVAIVSLIRPAAIRPSTVTEQDVERAIPVVDAQDYADSNLVRMADKRVLFSESGKAFIMYGIQGRSWVALGDPVGSPSDVAELVWRFVETARAAGGRAAFYQVSPSLLSYCADAGLRAYKLGELAIVDLQNFELAGSRLAGLRQSYNRGKREGLEFSVIEPPEVADVIEDLRAVSDAWLAHHNTREKGFSLGAFRDDYITAQPVAILRAGGRIVAFSTLLVTGTRSEASVDLMRFVPDAPKGSMDFLFVSIMEYMRDRGYSTFNLGMAPLSGMSRRESAPVWDRIGALVFEHGEKFYNFRGLRAFKSKFHPRWEPRYLAVTGTTGAALVLMDVTLLISGGMRGVVGK